MNERSISLFSNAVDNLTSTKFILSSQAISDLLRVVASDENMFAILTEAMKGFNYSLEFDRACIDPGNGMGFHLPFGKLRTIALVTCLLYSFDSGEKSITDFLDKYYYGENTNVEFTSFCKAVIEPYKKAFIDVLSGKNEDGIEETVDDKNPSAVPDGAVVQIEYIIREINAHVMADPVTEKEEKEKLILLTDGMNRALECRDVRLIKALLVGMNFAFNGNPKISKKLKDVEACLKLYLVI